MMEAGLVTSLIAYFDISLIVTCITEFDDLSKTNHSDLPVLQQTVETLDIMSAIKNAGTHQSLILCPNANFSQLSLEPMAFAKNAYWFFDEDDLLVESDLQKLPLTFTSNVLVAIKLPDGSFNLHEHYAIKSIPKTTHFGTWNKSDGLMVEKHLLERRKDFTDVDIVVTVKNLPYMLTIQSETEISGWFADVISYIQKDLNFSMTIIKPSDGKWGGGKAGPDGSVVWNGMVAQLMQKEADICGASLTITLERSKVIDFGIGLVEDIHSIHIVNPHATGGSSRDINLMVYLMVFSKLAWIGILVIAILFATQFVLINYFKPNPCQNRTIFTSFLVGFCHFFFDLINTSDSFKTADGLATKSFVLVSSIVGYVLLAFYAGDLTASMTVGTKSDVMKSLQEVIDRGYTISITAETAQHNHFKLAEPNTIRHKVYNTILQSNNDSEIFFETKPTKQVWFGPIFRRLNDPEFIFVANFEERLKSQLAFAFQKDSEIKQIFDYHIIKFKQSGLMEELQDKWFYDNKPKDDSGRIFQEEPINLGFENLFFPMLVMLVGITACTMTLIYEILNEWQKQTNMHLNTSG